MSEVGREKQKSEGGREKQKSDVRCRTSEGQEQGTEDYGNGTDQFCKRFKSL